MKILHLNTMISGGAGQAAHRLHQSLLSEGVNSSMLFLHNDSDDPKKESYLTYKTKINNYLLRAQIFRYQKSLNYGRSKNKEIMTASRSLFDAHRHKSIAEADIIHLHYISNFIDVPSFIKEIDKPIVWTLHDMWPFTGGCHYSDGCMKFQDKCSSCPEVKEWNYGTVEKEQLKKRKIAEKRLAIVCLSEWMKRRSQESFVFQDQDHHLIRNSINTETFSMRNKEELRAKYQIPSNIPIFFFAAGNLLNYRKGFDQLLGAIDKLEEEGVECFIITAGKSSPRLNLLKNHKNFGSIQNEGKMAELYSMADAYLLSSIEDNLPNVMVESLSCGTPVISNPTGGMQDIIEEGFNGFFSSDFSSEGFLKAIKKFINQKDSIDRDQIRKAAIDKFAPPIQSSKYIEVYKSLLK